MSELKAIRMNPDEVAKHVKRPSTTKARKERYQQKLDEVFALEKEQRGAKK